MKSSKHAERRKVGEMPVRDWYTLPNAELLVKARQVWGLLRWYHHAWVVPNRGIRGVLRRMWWRLTGNRQKLLSPWELLDLKIAAMYLEAQEAAAQEAADPQPAAGSTTIEVVKR